MKSFSKKLLETTVALSLLSSPVLAESRDRDIDPEFRSRPKVEEKQAYCVDEVAVQERKSLNELYWDIGHYEHLGDLTCKTYSDSQRSIKSSGMECTLKSEDRGKGITDVRIFAERNALYRDGFMVIGTQSYDPSGTIEKQIYAAFFKPRDGDLDAGIVITADAYPKEDGKFPSFVGKWYETFEVAQNRINQARFDLAEGNLKSKAVQSLYQRLFARACKPLLAELKLWAETPVSNLEYGVEQ